MAVYPFIILRDDKDRLNKRLLRHERIHLEQQVELLILPFYLMYLYYYLRGRSRGHTHIRAYRDNPFEREARALEDGGIKQKFGFLNFLNY